MAKQKKVTVNGEEYTLQSVSPTWYFGVNDDCGMTGGGQPCGEMDVLEKLTILTDAAKYDAACTSSGGNRRAKAGYIGNTPEKLIKAIETFLRE